METGPHIKELAALIEKHTKDYVLLHTNLPRNYEKEARWYAAYQIAEEMRECYTTRDWADFVLNGMQPLTDEDVKLLFDPEETGTIYWPSRAELRRFYGLNPQE